MFVGFSVNDHEIVNKSVFVDRERAEFVITPQRSIHEIFVFVASVREIDVTKETSILRILHRVWLPVIECTDELDFPYVVDRFV